MYNATKQKDGANIPSSLEVKTFQKISLFW